MFSSTFLATEIGVQMSSMAATAPTRQVAPSIINESSCTMPSLFKTDPTPALNWESNSITLTAASNASSGLAPIVFAPAKAALFTVAKYSGVLGASTPPWAMTIVLIVVGSHLLILAAQGYTRGLRVHYHTVLLVFEPSRDIVGALGDSVLRQIHRKINQRHQQCAVWSGHVFRR